MHNAFRKAIEANFGQDFVQFVLDIHKWFKLSAARMDDYETVQKELGLKQNRFLKHDETRWLPLGPALCRIIEQWKGIQEYFLKKLLKDNSLDLLKNPRYKRIRLILEQKDHAVVNMAFLVNITDMFEPFLGGFQTEAPLIHQLYTHLQELFRCVLGRLLKSETILGKTTRELLDLSFDDHSLQLKDSHLEIGEVTRKALQRLSVSQQRESMLRMRKFLTTVANYLKHNLPFDNAILKSARCLDPVNKNESWTVLSIKTLTRSVETGREISVTQSC